MQNSTDQVFCGDFKIENKKARVLWLDVIRILAAFMVIFIHSPHAKEGMSSNIYYAVYNYMMLPCVPLFFMISGYLLLPTRDALFPFLRKRMARIVFPLLFWSVIALIFEFEDSLSNFLLKICYIPFCSRAFGIYWFLYSLISVYVILPIISEWLKSAKQKEIQFMLCLWLFASTLPYLNLLLPKVFDYNNYQNLLYYNAGFLGYFIMGYYFKKFAKGKHLFIAFVLMIFTSVFSLLLIFLSKENVITMPFVNPYLGIDVIFQTLFIFFVVKRGRTIFERFEKIIVFLAPLTFGVYLIHGFILKYITKSFVYNVLNLPTILAVPTCAIITFAISIIFVYLLSKLPKSKYIIG